MTSLINRHPSHLHLRPSHFHSHLLILYQYLYHLHRCHHLGDQQYVSLKNRFCGRHYLSRHWIFSLFVEYPTIFIVFWEVACLLSDHLRLISYIRFIQTLKVRIGKYASSFQKQKPSFSQFNYSSAIPRHPCINS